MIGISRLYCGVREGSDAIRYAARSADGAPAPARRRPVVVFNCTRRCNLGCRHCYSASDAAPAPDEMTTADAHALIDDLSACGVPVLLFSGGEPLLRADVFDLIARAAAAGVRPALSTNGTLIDPTVAERLAAAGCAYVGVSIDGVGETNDRFRGRAGAFAEALDGVRACRDAGVKVGLRFTMHRGNADDVPRVFDLVERESIPRVCFYHLVYTGRGSAMRRADLSHAETRRTLDVICEGAARLHDDAHGPQVLTVDNHADGPYVYLRLLREDAARAAQCLRLLRANGGNASGERIACVSWNGDVTPDQFWRTRVVGNVLERPFSEIWSDDDQPLLAALRNRREHLNCRCLDCRWLDVCNGNFRARAEADGDPWGDDPACYLTDEEIAPVGEGAS